MVIVGGYCAGKMKGRGGIVKIETNKHANESTNDPYRAPSVSKSIPIVEIVWNGLIDGWVDEEERGDGVVG